MEVLIVTQQEKWHFATCKKRGSDRIYVLTANNNFSTCLLPEFMNENKKNLNEIANKKNSKYK